MSEKLIEPEFPGAEAMDAPKPASKAETGLNIVVCIKQVPDSAQIRVHPVTNTIMRQGVPTIINPYDLFALEEAMRLRDEFGGAVTVLTMGPPMAEDALRRALGLGADKAVLITDRRFAGSDTLATSFALASALDKIGEVRPVDIVFTGKQTIDGDTAQVGPGIARRMGLNQLTYVSAIDALDCERGEITVRRRSEGGVQVLRSKLPCLITMLEDTNELRRGTLQDMLRAARAPVTIWSAEDAGIEDALKCGLRGSPTVVKRVFAPSPRAEKAEMVAVEGKTPAQTADAMLDLLFAKAPKLEADLTARFT
ncbi:electron transfer flavoprotein subunit beta/FixA family protein [Rhodovulum steppense]|uniref:Protein FixA n=1 Tax=Rhodovulum steppense TaxID=540251 RepID=A0A4R1YW65_9RHOB|nr:electron transfer flavoprotein subunit beta/FixA family protein [Rhodovulum steppense]TCM85216.1 electron transfer flavoprotein beta subunit [Rhodovulum steppense]